MPVMLSPILLSTLYTSSQLIFHFSSHSSRISLPLCNINSYLSHINKLPIKLLSLTHRSGLLLNPLFSTADTSDKIDISPSLYFYINDTSVLAVSQADILNFKCYISLESSAHVWKTVSDSSSTAALKVDDKRSVISSVIWLILPPPKETHPWLPLSAILPTSCLKSGWATSYVMNFSSIDILFAFIIYNT